MFGLKVPSSPVGDSQTQKYSPRNRIRLTKSPALQPRYQRGPEHRTTAGIYEFCNSVLSSNESFETRIDRVLEIGIDVLELDTGAVISIHGNVCEVDAAISYKVDLRKGQLYCMANTHCKEAQKKQKTLQIVRRAVDSHVLQPAIYLGTPIWVDNRFYGTLEFCAYGQRRQPFCRSEIQFVEFLARWLATELRRKEMESALQYRLGFEQLINSISANFIHLPPQEIDSGIRRALEQIGKFAGVQRSYVFLFRDNQKKMDCTHWWNTFVPPEKRRFDDMSVDHFSWSMDCIKRNQTVCMPVVSELPIEAANERDIFQSQGAKSVIFLPLAYGGVVNGFVGFASMRFEREWDQDTVVLLQMAGQIIANALEHKRAQDELAELEEQVRHSQKLESLGILAGGIAHDFNNLLMGILGNVELANRELPDGLKVKTRLEKISKVATHAAGLTNQLLAYSGKGKFVVRIVNIADTIGEMARLLEASISKRVRIEYSSEDSAPCVEVDVAQLQQVIMNLITNASEAMEEAGGVIRLETGVLEADQQFLSDSFLGDEIEPGNYAYIRVTDEGCGMNEETKSRIFDPFFTTKFTGRGLGLAAVLGIVRGHRGTINVVSQPQRGTTFTVLLPIAEGTPIEIQEVASARPLVIDGNKVLIVDDEEMVRTVSQEILEEHGFIVCSAENGLSAIELFAREHQSIDAVLLDMTMPDMTGDQVFMQLREIKSDIKVILVSGYSEQDAIRNFDAHSLSGFLQKPFGPETLVEKLSGVLKGSYLVADVS